MKGMGQYSWPPCTNLFRSAPFRVKILFIFFTKQAQLIRRSTVPSLPPQLVFPGLIIDLPRLTIPSPNKDVPTDRQIRQKIWAYSLTYVIWPDPGAVPEPRPSYSWPLCSADRPGVDVKNFSSSMLTKRPPGKHFQPSLPLKPEPTWVEHLNLTFASGVLLKVGCLK